MKKFEGTTLLLFIVPSNIFIDISLVNYYSLYLVL